MVGGSKYFLKEFDFPGSVSYLLIYGYLQVKQVGHLWIDHLTMHAEVYYWKFYLYIPDYVFRLQFFSMSAP
jgi:hypothetical protein